MDSAGVRWWNPEDRRSAPGAPGPAGLGTGVRRQGSPLVSQPSLNPLTWGQTSAGGAAADDVDCDAGYQGGATRHPFDDRASLELFDDRASLELILTEMLLG